MPKQARGARIGSPARSSRTGRPVMVLLDLLGRRWALRILFELDTHGTLTFSQLLERCDPISPSVLSQRLRELTENRILEQRSEGYALTRVARSLREPLDQLYTWSNRWARTASAAKKKTASRPGKAGSKRR